MLRKLAKLILLSVLALAPIMVYPQSGGRTFYVYDDNGRLSSVITPNGEAAVYEYDAAGNFTAIRRLASDTLEIISFSPRQGPAGTQVTIYGTGFGMGINSVAFNGLTAQIISSNFASVVAEVPVGATTGPISISTPRGSVTSNIPFTVKGVLVLPRAITVMANENVQFQAIISGITSPDLTWSVNGQDGGSQTVGTITAGGFYTAPNLINSPALQFFVRATSVEDPSLFSESIVTVVSLGEGYQFRNAGVSVRYGTPVNNPPTYINGGVSVRYGTPVNSPPTYVNGAVSVRYGTPTNNPPVFINGAVSVRYGTPPNNLPTYTNGAVSVRYGTPPNILSTFVSGAVSVSKGPVLTSLSPVTITRGNSVTLTISGVGLNGANSIKFYRLDNSNSEPGITVSNIVITGDASLAATLTVDAAVPPGRYLVVVITPLGATLRNEAGGNTIQITQ